MQEKKYTFHPTDQMADKEKTMAEVVDEKQRGASYVGELEEQEFQKSDGDDIITIDPFVPFNDLPDERHWIVTFRAMVSHLFWSSRCSMQCSIRGLSFESLG